MDQRSFKTPKEVEGLLEDSKTLGQVNDGHNWYVTEEWAKKFRRHLKALLPIAESGDLVAQYYVATIYLCGYLYATEEGAIRAYEKDALVMTKWFERAAKSGYVVAIDNLIATGVGREAELLKKLYLEHRHSLENTPAPSEGWLRDMELLYEIVYGNS